MTRDDAVFVDVCTNTNCLEGKGSAETLRCMRDMAQGNVTVAECGCLGNCGKGPNVEFVIPGEEGLVYHAVEGAAGAAAFLEEHCAGTPAAQVRSFRQHGAAIGEEQTDENNETSPAACLRVGPLGQRLILIN